MRLFSGRMSAPSMGFSSGAGRIDAMMPTIFCGTGSGASTTASAASVSFSIIIPITSSRVCSLLSK